MKTDLDEEDNFIFKRTMALLRMTEDWVTIWDSDSGEYQVLELDDEVSMHVDVDPYKRFHKKLHSSRQVLCEENYMHNVQ